MSDEAERVLTGGCLCGGVRYEAVGAPLYQGLCFCADCRKASGSGFIPYMGFAAGGFRLTGEVRTFRSPAANGNVSSRNFCPTCGGLVFGGELGESDSFTVYAGSLDQADAFIPNQAIFMDGHPDWAEVPDGLQKFGRGPQG